MGVALCEWEFDRRFLWWEERELCGRQLWWQERRGFVVAGTASSEKGL